MRNENARVCKPGKDSYHREFTGGNRNVVGTLQYQLLAKPGMRQLSGLDLLHYMSYRANRKGFDYIVLDKGITNSGRYEAVRITLRSINVGRKLSDDGYTPEDRISDSPSSYLCRGEVIHPWPSLPCKYDDLPALSPVQMKLEDCQSQPLEPVPVTDVTAPQSVPDPTATVDNFMLSVIEDKLTDPNSDFSRRVVSEILNIAIQCLKEAAIKAEADHGTV